MHETATVFGRGHRSRTLLNLLGTFFHSSTFWKRSSSTPCYSSCFNVCALVVLFFDIFLVNYLETKLHCYRKTTAQYHKLLLGNREQVVLRSSQAKLR